MWIFLNDALFSVVHTNCSPDEVLVRAWRHADIQSVFGNVCIFDAAEGEWGYWSIIKRRKLADALTLEVFTLGYGMFTDSVTDPFLSCAYKEAWIAMQKVQACQKSVGCKM